MFRKQTGRVRHLNRTAKNDWMTNNPSLILRIPFSSQLVGVPSLRHPQILFICLGLFLALALPNALFSDSKLSEKSPFLPPGAKETKKPEPTVQPQGPISREIEFKGVVKIGDVFQFSIFNKKDQKSYWIKEDEREGGISVSNYDAGSNSIIVLMNGRSERVTLTTATDTPLPVALSKPTTPPNNIRPPALPPQLQNNSAGNRPNSVPRRTRRVILPKKTN